MRLTKLTVCLAGGLILGAAGGHAQAPEAPKMPVFDPVKLQAEVAVFNKKPDNIGTGPYPALKEMVASLPNHVIYRPQDLGKLKEKLGVLAWGNGGCSADGAGARFHLTEIASHGYLAIASGTIQSGPGAPPPAAESAPQAPVERGPNGMPLHIPPPATHADLLTQAIAWALAENERKGSPYYGRINPQWVAVSGWSCGGLQALEVAGDPRIATVLIHSSGIFNGNAPIPGITITKAALEKLHTSIIYILGGPSDIAYANGMDDYERINSVPVFVANLDVGHGGTFMEPNGGRAASVAVSWLDWQLKGDAQAGKRFLGTDCGLCKDSDWKVAAKNLSAVKH